MLSHLSSPPVCMYHFCKTMHRECLLGLGEALMAEASLILDKNEPEEAEVHLMVVVALIYCVYCINV